MSAPDETPQHTPGPWHIEQADPDLPPYVVSDVTGLVVCDLVGPPDRTEANATLIAAAPDLLAACKGAATYFATKKRAGTVPILADLIWAIAKAEGRNQ
jgi:hypothetical protein